MPDLYSPNPLAEMLQERDPYRYEQVAAVKEPPKLFAGGAADVPAFTASGIDPQLLLKLPVGVRHAAAANPNITQVFEWFETYAEFPEAEIDHDGLRAAKLRVEDWLANTDLDTRTPAQRDADEAEEYRQFFPVDQDRAAYAVEQKRRERAGEDPLEEYATLNQRRTEREIWAASTPEAEAKFEGFDLDALRAMMQSGGPQ